MRPEALATATDNAPATDVVLLHSAHEAAFAEGNAERLAWHGRGIECFDRPFSAERLAEITRVQLWAPHSDQIETLPEVIGAMPSLDSLTISGSSLRMSALADAKQGSFPDGLRELSLLHDDGKVLRWPEVVFPGLTSLYIDGRFRFDNTSFPRLESLSFRPDAAMKLVRQALLLPLVELNLHLVPADQEVFDVLAARPLRRLGLLGGRKLTALTAIDRLPGLESLRLKNLPGLRDIAGLRSLTALSVLNLQYCSNIENIEVINDLDALRSLRVVRCGDTEAIEARLTALDPSGTRA